MFFKKRCIYKSLTSQFLGEEKEESPSTYHIPRLSAPKVNLELPKSTPKQNLKSESMKLQARDRQAEAQKFGSFRLRGKGGQEREGRETLTRFQVEEARQGQCIMTREVRAASL
jgi:hypothetical protein